MRSGVASSGQFQNSTVAASPKLPKTRMLRYVVRVETSLPLAANDVARQVQSILDDPRGWVGTRSAPTAGTSYALVSDAKQANFVITLASPKTAATLCPQDLKGVWSCDDGQHLVLNYDRWQFSAPAYRDVDAYRAFLINHTVGRYLGLSLLTCPGVGRRAPVMMQQDRGLGGCLANPWPTLTN